MTTGQPALPLLHLPLSPPLPAFRMSLLTRFNESRLGARDSLSRAVKGFQATAGGREEEEEEEEEDEGVDISRGRVCVSTLPVVGVGSGRRLELLSFSRLNGP